MRVLSLVRSSLIVATMLACTSERAMGPTAAPEAGPSLSHTPAGLPLLVITEVMPNPKAANDVGEYIEIFNAGASAANLNGMSVRSGSGTGSNVVTVAITTSVPIASGACVLLSTHSAPINGIPVAFTYGTGGGSLQFTNSSAIDYMELLSGTTVVDRVQVGFVPGTSYDGFSLYLIETTNDITLVDNSVISLVSGAVASPWKKATTADDTWGPTATAERGTPGRCNYGRHVVAGEVATVNVNAMQIASSQTGVVSASAADAFGNSVPTSFTWTSDNESVVRVVNASTGAIEALAVGTANLTATAANGVQGSGVVTVIDGNAIDRITVSFSNSPTLVPGYQRRAFVSVFNVLGQRVFPTVTYTTADAAVATVDSRGYITARAPGSTTLTASVDGKAGVATVNVQTILHPTATYMNHTEFGDPFDGNAADDLILRKREYSLSYSVLRGGPAWVSWNLNSTQFNVPGRPRCDCFSQDQELAALGVAQADIIHDWDYVGGGYDRGHMVQSASRNKTDTQNASTFLMTNMLPQAAANNQGPWNDMEEDLNDLASAGKELYIIAGGIYSANPATLLNSGGGVQVPDYTWKVAVVMPSRGTAASIDYFDDFQIIAVKMPNDTLTAVRNIDWHVYETTVDQIEAETGLDLLRGLPDLIEMSVEAGNRPPVAAMSVPSSTTEGSAILLNAGASSDIDGDELTYTWTLSDGTTLNGALVSHVFADNVGSPHTVTLTVRDPLGAWNTKSTTVTVSNAAPVATLSAESATSVSGEAFTVTGSFTDAGLLDNPWSVSIDWGQGTVINSVSSTQGSMTASHVYSATGTYTVTFTVTDKDGGFSSRTFDVSVVRRAIGLIAHEEINDNAIGNGSIKVTALGDAGFDVSTVDLSTACISGVCVREKGNSGQVFASMSDVDGDGDLDLVMRFARRDLVRVGALPLGSPELVFRATLTDGRQVEGRTTVNVH